MSRSRALNRTPLPSTRTCCTPPPSPPARFLLAPPSLPPFLLHFLTLLLLFLLLSSRLWMPSSLTVWTREGKEKRVGWRTSGRNGRASLSFISVCFFLFTGMQQHGCVWPCKWVAANMLFSCNMSSPCILKLRTGMPLKESGCIWLCVCLWLKKRDRVCSRGCWFMLIKNRTREAT